MKRSLPRRMGRLAIIVVALTALSPWAAWSATKYWKTSSISGGSWSNGANWSAVSPSGGDFGGVPGGGDTVNIALVDGNSRTINYDYTGNPVTLSTLLVNLTNFSGNNTSNFSMSANNLTAVTEYFGDSAAGSNGRGTMNQTGGLNTIAAGNGLYLGVNSTDQGFYNLSGTGALTSNGLEIVGYNGAGTFTQDGGTNTSNVHLYLGYSANSSGTYNLNSGSLTNPSGEEYVGYGGTGALMQTGGTHSAAFVYLGSQGNSTGTYTLQNGSLATAAFQFVGLNGTGTFNQTGGTNTIDSIGLGNGYGALNVGSGPGGVGNYTLNGGSVSVLVDPLAVGFTAGSKGTFNLMSGSLSSQGDEDVGYSGTGTFNQTGGTNTVTSGNLVVGAFAGSVGTYTLSAGSASTSHNVMVGPGGVGVLTVTGTGVLTTNSLQVFRSPTTPGTVVNLTGGTINTSALNLNGTLAAFNWTGGTLNLTSDVTWDSAADPTTTSSAFGPSLVLNNTQTLSVAGNEILGGVGPFGLTLNGGSMHTVAGSITISATGTLTLNGGTLNVGTLVNSGTFNFIAGTLGINQAGANLNFPIVTGSPSTININADNISVGSGSSFAGFNHQGVLNVGAFNVTLNSAGYARLGVLTSLSGGSISAPNGVYLSGGGNLVGSGAVKARLTGDSGSVIEATGALALGDASSPAGFSYAGELHTKQFTVTLNSSGPATLGNLTTLGSGAIPGTLSAANGFVVDFGKAVTGYGTINSTNTLATLATINGTVQGDSPAHPITLSGYIKGTGTFNNVNFSGTFSPGLSPTVATVGNISLVPTNTLIMEIGGTDPGSGYDKIQASGTLALGGALDVALIGSFTPTAGQMFDLFDWTTLSGKFSSIMLPNLNNGPLGWDTSHLYTTGVLTVTATLRGDINRDGHVDVADVSALMSALGDLDQYRSTYGLADPQQFKLVADVNDDGQVNNFDLQALTVVLANSGSGGGQLAAVPEPTSRVLAFAAFLCTIWWKVRQDSSSISRKVSNSAA
jgi:hypothetical protein